MFHSILVPLDGSPFSEQALPLALSIARRAGIPLQVAHAHVSLAPLYADPRAGFENTLDPKFRAQEQVYLDGVIQRLAKVAPQLVSSALLDGPVPEALLEHVAARGADLIVMSSHGRGPLSRVWLGSVADHIVRRSSVPVLIVRPREEKADVAKDESFEHVIIPLDGSEEAEFIIEPAVALGRLLDADYTLLRVVEPPVPVGYDPVTGGMALAELPSQEEEEARAKIYLDRLAERLRQRAFRVHTCVVTNAHAAHAIVEESDRQPGSIIAIQTHARRGLARLLLGSVADKVLRSASVPVLISRPHVK